MSDQVSDNTKARFECRICWQVYDPSIGDDVWQIPPGTAFQDLPESWHCPNCDAEKDQFLRIDEANGHA